jgi:hypothetical protein
VKAAWAICPHCGEELRDREPRRPGQGGIEADIRLDQHGVGALTIGLAILGALGLAVAAPLALPLVGSGALLFLLAVLAVFTIFYYRRPQEERSVALAAVRTLTTVGVLIASLVAFLIVFIAVCIVFGGAGGGK